MTAAELHVLLERVEAHGGLPGLSMDRSSVWAVSRDDKLTFSPEGASQHEWLTDHLVGVLKRDLEAKGHEWSSWHVPSQGHGAAIYPWGNTQGKFIKEDGLGSELEAVLKAWLAAAKAEGWGAS